MANKDGIVSIGFDYKKELDEVCATIEKELNNLGGDINLSDGIKKQMAEIKKMITDMKKDIGSSFDKITETKLDTKTFESFKKDVNKRIREVNKEVTILKEQFSALDGSANVNGIVQQFANLKKHVEDSNASISEFISNSEKLGKSVVISSNLNTDGLKNDVVEIKKLLTDLNKEDLDFGYTNKSAKELSSDLEGLVDKYYKITDLIDEMKSSMSDLDSTTQEYKNQEVQLSKLSLELLKCSAQMDDLFGAKNAEKINVDQIISVDELDDIFAHIQNISSKIKLEAKNIVESIELSNVAVKNVNNNITSDLSNKSNIELHISTKQSTINKQLDEMIDNLQERAANKPIIAPVKLRVDSEYEKTTKDASASALTENQINEARKDVESVVPGLEKAFNNSMRIATNKAVETAKESIKAVREFFETNPITVHLTVPDEEKAKIGKAILSEDGKTTVNISGEVDKARKSVKGLSEDLEKSQLLIKENAQNAKNLSLEKLVNSLSETMSQFSELKGIISSIQNMENTIARVSGISSTNELVEQWNIVEKTIINATKLDGDFRKNANIGKIVSEYQKYIDMGGTNSLSGIDKIKDNETTINSILSKMKELKIQDVENDSIQKLSVDLDGVIAKFDELISTVKTATNALYKIIKQGNVSDLDKQWSSISDKFKSIADESGKINLSKQKTDIKELMDMYQKYTNAGGTNSLMSLTDNVETLRKLDKEYQKLNQTQTVDNSSTIEKESESFKNVEKSVDSLTTAIGDTKVQAINIEATAMEDAAEREIMAITSILDNLDLIVSRLKDIKGIKLPKIEVKNVDVVEKAVESLANAGNKSNISSENSIVEGQNKIQEELKETQENSTITNNSLQNDAKETAKNIHYVTNALGEVTVAYRGLRDTMAAGLSSDRYHGGTFWTDNLELAKEYSQWTKVESANLEMLNPLEIEGNGSNWNNIEWLGHNSDEASRKIIKARKDIDSLRESIKYLGYDVSKINLTDNDKSGFASYETVIDALSNRMSDVAEAAENTREYIASIKGEEFAKNYEDPILKVAIEELNLFTDAVKRYREVALDDSNTYGLFDTNKFVELAKKSGYDGVIFKNIIDSYSGDVRDISNVMVTFEQNQTHFLETISVDPVERIRANFKSVYGDISELAEKSKEEYSEIFRQMDSIETNFKNGNIDKKERANSLKKIYQENPEIPSFFNYLNQNAFATSFNEALDNSNFDEQANLILDFIRTAKNDWEALENSVSNGKLDFEKVNSLVTEFGFNDIVNDYISKIQSLPEIEKQARRGLIDFSNVDDMEKNISEIEAVYPILSKFKEQLVKISSAEEDVGEKAKLISDIYKEYLGDFNNKWNSFDTETPIKDVFQGDEASKINEVAEATNNLADAENRLNIIEDKKSAEKYWQGRFKDSVADITKTNDELLAMRQYYSELEKLNDKITSAQNKVDNANIDIGKLSKRDVQSDDYVKAVENYRIAIDELQNHITYLNNNGIQSQDDINELNRLQSVVDEISKSIKNMSASEKGTNLAKSSTVFLKIEELRDKYKGMSKDMQRELDRLERKFAGLGASIDTGRAIGELKQFETQLIKTGTATNSLWSAMKDKAFYNFANQLGTMVSFYDVISGIRQCVTTVRELDTALTEMRKVSDEGLSSLKKYQDLSFDVADEIGSTALALQDATATWMRLGESLSEASESAKDATILMNVSEFESIDEATDSLISMSQAFKELDKMEIIDVLDKIGNEYSISTDNLSRALQDSAAVLKTQGNDLYESVALITAGNAINQDYSKTAGGVRTISLRLAGTEEAKEELFSLGEDVDDFIVQTNSKTQELIKDYTAVASNAYKGVDVLDANGNLRNTYNILLDISKIYKEIQEEDKKAGTNRAQALVEYIAGKNRSNIASSILLNPELLESVYESAKNADGAAMKELDAYMESLDAKVAQFQNRLQELESDLVNSDFLKGAIDFGTEFIHILDEIINKFGVLPTIMTGVGAGLGIKNLGKVYERTFSNCFECALYA